MEFWTNLGIEQTKDEDAITAAYREKLKLVNPEDKPEEFMQLRAEYEAALKYARETAEDDADPSTLTPVGAWMRRVKEVYNDFPRRIDDDEWRTLLSDEVCDGIDSRLDARDELLKFLMDSPYIPNRTYRILDEKFDFRENRDELCERFPEGFIDDMVIASIDSSEVIKLDMFDKSTTGNPDAYFSLWFKARRELGSREFEAASATLEDIEKTGIIHPYTKLLRSRYIWLKDSNAEDAMAIADELYSQYPDDDYISMLYADMLFNSKRYDEALTKYDAIIAADENDFSAKIGKARTLFEQGKLEDSKKIFFELLDKSPRDQYIIDYIDKINDALKKNYDEALEDGGDFESRINYAWSCLQTNMVEKAYELATALEPKSLEEVCDKENILTKICLSSDRNEEALIHADAWYKGVQQLPEGETEIEIKRKGKTGEILYLMGSGYSSLKHYDEALAKTDEILALEKKKEGDIYDAYNLRRIIYFSQKKYDEAAEAAEKAVECKDNAVSNIMLGIALYEAGRKQDSFHAFGRALDTSHDYISYIYRGRILADYDEWDEVRKLLDFLGENGVDTPATRYLHALVLQSEEKKDETLNMLNAIITGYEKAAEEGKEPENGGYTDDEKNDAGFIMHEVYSLAAEMQEDTKEPAELVEMLNKGLACREDYYPLLSFKAFLLDNRLDKHQEALDVYFDINRRWPKNTYALSQIGHIYFDNFNNYDKALEYYLRSLELKQDSHINNCAARCLTYFRRYDEAKQYFDKAIELNPDNERAKMNLAMLYEYQYKFEDSRKILCGCHKADLAKNEKGEKGDRLVHKNYERVLCRMGKYKEALDVAVNAYKIFGNEYEARSVIEICVEAGFFDEAEKFIDEYRKADKINDMQKLRMLSDIRFEQGRFKEQLKYIEEMSDDFEKTKRLASFYKRDKKYNRAAQLYKKLLREHPDDVYDCTDYIAFLRETGNEKESVETAKIFAEKNAYLKEELWHYMLYVTRMAHIYAYSGQFEEAKRYLDEAMNLPLCEHCRYGKCKDMLSVLAKYYEEMGDYDKALETYQQALEVCKDDGFRYDIEEIRKKYKHKLKKENRK